MTKYKKGDYIAYLTTSQMGTANRIKVEKMMGYTCRGLFAEVGVDGENWRCSVPSSSIIAKVPKTDAHTLKAYLKGAYTVFDMMKDALEHDEGQFRDIAMKSLTEPKRRKKK